MYPGSNYLIFYLISLKNWDRPLDLNNVNSLKYYIHNKGKSVVDQYDAATSTVLHLLSFVMLTRCFWSAANARNKNSSTIIVFLCDQVMVVQIDLKCPQDIATIPPLNYPDQLNWIMQNYNWMCLRYHISSAIGSPLWWSWASEEGLRQMVTHMIHIMLFVTFQQAETGADCVTIILADESNKRKINTASG